MASTGSVARRLALLTLAALVVRLAFVLLEPATHPVGDERTWTDWAHQPGQPPRPLLAAAHPPHLLSARLSLFPGRSVRRVGHVRGGTLGAGGHWRAARARGRPGRGARLLPARGPVGGGGRRVLSRARLVLRALLVGDGVHGPALVGDRAAAGRGPRRAAWGAPSPPAPCGGRPSSPARPSSISSRWRRPGWPRVAPGAGARAGRRLPAWPPLLVVAPWTYRNWVEFHAFDSRLDRRRPEPLPGQRAHPARRDLRDGRRRAGAGRAVPLRDADGPAGHSGPPAGWWIFEKLRDEMPRLWEADSLVLVHIKRGAYGAVAPAVAVAAAARRSRALRRRARPLRAGSVAPHLGRAARPCSSSGFLAYYNLIHVVTHGFARYRLPVMPVVFLIAGVGWAAWRAGDLARMSGRARAPAAAAGRGR